MMATPEHYLSVGGVEKTPIPLRLAGYIFTLNEEADEYEIFNQLNTFEEEYLSKKMWINGEGFQSDTIGVGLKKSADVVETQLIESKVTGKQRVQVLVTLLPRGLL